MGLTLRSNGAHPYSAKERALFSLLRPGETVSTAQLLAGLYDRRKTKKPINARIAMVGAMRSLITKVERNKEPFRIRKSDRRGPHPMLFTLEHK